MDRNVCICASWPPPLWPAISAISPSYHLYEAKLLTKKIFPEVSLALTLGDCWLTDLLTAPGGPGPCQDVTATEAGHTEVSTLAQEAAQCTGLWIGLTVCSLFWVHWPFHWFNCTL